MPEPTPRHTPCMYTWWRCWNPKGESLGIFVWCTVICTYCDLHGQINATTLLLLPLLYEVWCTVTYTCTCGWYMEPTTPTCTHVGCTQPRKCTGGVTQPRVCTHGGGIGIPQGESWGTLCGITLNTKICTCGGTGESPGRVYAVNWGVDWGGEQAHPYGLNGPLLCTRGGRTSSGYCVIVT